MHIYCNGVPMALTPYELEENCEYSDLDRALMIGEDIRFDKIPYKVATYSVASDTCATGSDLGEELNACSTCRVRPLPLISMLDRHAIPYDDKLLEDMYVSVSDYDPMCINPYRD